MTKVFLVETDERGGAIRALGEKMVRAVAGKTLGADPDTLVIGRADNGKPYLPGYTDFHFNLSHTVGAVTLAVSDNPVGVDMERIRPINRRLAERFFTEHEQRYILSAEQTADRLFFEVWTRKEAFLKRSGRGIRVALNSFDVLDGGLAGEIHTREYRGFILSCCCEEWRGDLVAVSSDKL